MVGGGTIQPGQKYCTARDISDVLRLDYVHTRLNLKRLASEGKVRKSGLRYHIEDFLQLSFSEEAAPILKTIEEGVLTVSETHRIICEAVHTMHYTTVLRKVKANEIPSYQVGRTFRIPRNLLKKYLEEGRITYGGKKIAPSKPAKITTMNRTPARAARFKMTEVIL